MLLPYDSGQLGRAFAWSCSAKQTKANWTIANISFRPDEELLKKICLPPVQTLEISASQKTMGACAVLEKQVRPAVFRGGRP